MAAPKTAYPSRQPIESTMPVMARGIIKPDNETPAEPRARAQPRLSTNHLDRVTFTTSGPTMGKASPARDHRKNNELPQGFHTGHGEERG